MWRYVGIRKEPATLLSYQLYKSYASLKSNIERVIYYENGKKTSKGMVKI